MIKHEAWLRAEEDRVKIARMLARICELENVGVEALQRLVVEAKSQEDTGGLQREAADGEERPDKSCVLELECETSAAVVAVRSYMATLLLPPDSTVRESKLSRRSDAKTVVESCIRCGGCGHRHERCKAKAEAVIWGIDWSKRRKNRKRWREVQKKKKDTGMEAREAVKMKLAGGAMVVVDIAEVESGREDHSTRCTGSGAGASDVTILDGRVKEVDDLKSDEPPVARQSYEFKSKEVDGFEEEQPGAGGLLQVKLTMEVAGVGDSADFAPARTGTVPAKT